MQTCSEISSNYLKLFYHITFRMNSHLFSMCCVYFYFTALNINFFFSVICPVFLNIASIKDISGWDVHPSAIVFARYFILMLMSIGCVNMCGHGC